MSDWDQSVCDRCWDLFNPGRPAVHFLEPKEEICAICGEKHRSGIYVRADPKTVPYPQEGEAMREMTTAEFAKANLAGLEEPVAIRRYTKTVGVYYPEGYMAPTAVINMGTEASPEQVEALRLQLEAIDTLAPASQKITELEDEIKRLKKELAARPAVPGVPHTIINAGDPFAGLAKQDKEFFERKLGKKK